MPFTKATKRRSFARVALIGPAGSGKTYTALHVAKGLEIGARIAVIDTEHGSAAKYSHLVPFDVCQLDSGDPRAYEREIREAVRGGYDVLVIDSLSHAWMGRGGCLEMVDAAARRSSGGNSYFAWRDVTPMHRALVDTILSAQIHVIATMRSKTKYALDQHGGKTVPRKIGTAPVQRDGIEYEFDVVGELDYEHRMTITKSRVSSLDGMVLELPGEPFGLQLATWLSDGEEEGPRERTSPTPPTLAGTPTAAYTTAREWLEDEWGEDAAAAMAREWKRLNGNAPPTVEMVHRVMMATATLLEDGVVT